MPTSTATSEGTSHRVDADVVREWATATAKRWLAENPMDSLDETSTMEAVRTGVAQTISHTAAAMASAASRVGGECTTDPDQLRSWLSGCADALGEPEPDTSPERLIEGFSQTSRAAGSVPALRRWTAALRENVQAVGVGWIRGRTDGASSFSIARLGGAWTVVEHGWPENDDQLRTRMVLAAAGALVRQARASGNEPAPEATVAEQLNQDAARYSETYRERETAATAPETSVR